MSVLLRLRDPGTHFLESFLCVLFLLCPFLALFLLFLMSKLPALMFVLGQLLQLYNPRFCAVRAALCGGEHGWEVKERSANVFCDIGEMYANSHLLVINIERTRSMTHIY